MKKEEKKSSGIPLVIIGVALLAVVAAGVYFYQSSKSGSASNANRASSSSSAPRAPQIPPNAPPGAEPPHLRGSPTAAVTVEEFADYQCGSCAAAHPVLKQIQSTYGSKIRFVFRNYPLPGHTKGFDAALAAEAAGLQGKYWEMQNQLFTNQSQWAAQNADARELWVGYATKIGLDPARFQQDMMGMAARNRVEQDLSRGRAAGVSGTPAIYINGSLVPATEYTEAGLSRLIDAELQKMSAARPPAQGNSNTAQ